MLEEVFGECARHNLLKTDRVHELHLVKHEEAFRVVEIFLISAIDVSLEHGRAQIDRADQEAIEVNFVTLIDLIKAG